VRDELAEADFVVVEAAEAQTSETMEPTSALEPLAC